MAVTAHKLTPHDLEALVEAGRIHPRAELIDGSIYDHVTPSHRHVAAAYRLEAAFAEEWGRAHVLRESPINTGDGSFPEPDLTLLNVPFANLDAHPTVSQIAAVVEVAGTSLQHDTTVKAQHYRAAGIGLYVVVDLDAATAVFGYEPSEATEISDRLLELCQAQARPS